MALNTVHARLGVMVIPQFLSAASIAALYVRYGMAANGQMASNVQLHGLFLGMRSSREDAAPSEKMQGADPRAVVTFGCRIKGLWLITAHLALAILWLEARTPATDR